jgi:hypothetical protein
MTDRAITTTGRAETALFVRTGLPSLEKSGDTLIRCPRQGQERHSGTRGEAPLARDEGPRGPSFTSEGTCMSRTSKALKRLGIVGFLGEMVLISSPAFPLSLAVGSVPTSQIPPAANGFSKFAVCRVTSRRAFRVRQRARALERGFCSAAQRSGEGHPRTFATCGWSFRSGPPGPPPLIEVGDWRLPGEVDKWRHRRVRRRPLRSRITTSRQSSTKNKRSEDFRKLLLP